MFRDGQELSEEVKMMEDSSEKTAPERELVPDFCMDVSVSNLNFFYSYMSNLLFNKNSLTVLYILIVVKVSSPNPCLSNPILPFIQIVLFYRALND